MLEPRRNTGDEPPNVSKTKKIGYRFAFPFFPWMTRMGKIQRAHYSMTSKFCGLRMRGKRYGTEQARSHSGGSKNWQMHGKGTQRINPMRQLGLVILTRSIDPEKKKFCTFPLLLNSSENNF